MKKIANKGFTMVELIVVIAIIAILSATLAPQYLKYVEQTKETSDLQLATSIVKAVTIAIANPNSNIEAGKFVEILWITGEESGKEVTRGSLMVRHPTKDRVSIYNNNDGVDELTPTSGDISILKNFAENIFSILGGSDERISDYPGWLQITFEDAKSELANQSNFAIHVNTLTGEVALAQYPNSLNPADANRWVEMGLDVIPAP